MLDIIFNSLFLIKCLVVIRISWDNKILFLSSKNKYYQMLLGVQICKNGRKFLHPNIKCPHFGYCYIIQSSKNWRQPLSRAVVLMHIFPFGSKGKVPLSFSMSGLWLLNENLFHSLLLVVCEPTPQLFKYSWKARNITGLQGHFGWELIWIF